MKTIINAIKLTLLIITAIFLTGCNTTEPYEETKISTVSKQDFNIKLESGDYTLIDVRTPEEFQAGNIEGSKLIDFYNPNFEKNLEDLDKTKKYLIYCRSGSRSSKALTIFRELGFEEVHDLKNGISQYYN